MRDRKIQREKKREGERGGGGRERDREYLNFRGPVAIWRPPTQNAVARFSLRSPNLTATVIVLKTSLPGSLGQRTRPLITGTLIVLTLN